MTLFCILLGENKLFGLILTVVFYSNPSCVCTEKLTPGEASSPLPSYLTHLCRANHSKTNWGSSICPPNITITRKKKRRIMVTEIKTDIHKCLFYIYRLKNILHLLYTNIQCFFMIYTNNTNI